MPPEPAAPADAGATDRSGRGIARRAEISSRGIARAVGPLRFLALLAALTLGPDFLAAQSAVPGPKAAAEPLIAAALASGSADTALATLEASSAAAKDPAVAAELLLAKASIEELRGAYSQALASLARAHSLLPAADPGRDAIALRLVRARLLSGDGERAREDALALALSARDEAARAEARIVAALALLLLSRADEAATELEALLAGAKAALKPRIYALLAAIDVRRGRPPTWGARLRAEFPASPEALASGRSEPYPAAFWVLGVGLGPVASAPPAVTPAPAGAPTATPTPTAAPASPTPPPAGGAGKPGAFLQVGSFSKRENAEILAESLRDLGFAAEARAAERGGRSFWIVILPDPKDKGATAAKLRELGYDSFAISLP